MIIRHSSFVIRHSTPVFPDFNRYSNPLLVALLLSVVFAVLLLRRYMQARRMADLLLAGILATGAIGLICYAIGFMGWYDTYRTTKINYFLLDTGVVIGPLVYLYVRFATDAALRWQRSMIWHFLPFLLYLVYTVVRFAFDSLQPGFDAVQNGYLMEHVDFTIGMPLMRVLSFTSALLYFAFGIQHYFKYSAGMENYFSNTEPVALFWLRNFLIAITITIVSDFLFLFIDQFVVQLHWMQNWWNVLIRGVVTVYLGVEGYRAGAVITAPAAVIEQQPALSMANITTLPPELEQVRQLLLQLIDSRRPFLDPELNLTDLATQLNIAPALLSQTINQGFGKNFNDFINEYRVEAVKSMILAGKKSQLTLLGIAFECGFNSKATFNRAFKKIVGIPPGDWNG